MIVLKRWWFGLDDWIFWVFGYGWREHKGKRYEIRSDMFHRYLNQSKVEAFCLLYTLTLLIDGVSILTMQS